MKFNDWKKHVEEITQNPSQYGIRECVLCGRELISIVGVLFPGQKLATAIHQPKGKHRTLFYGLCDECSKEPDAVDRVEMEMLKDVSEGKPINLLT